MSILSRKNWCWLLGHSPDKSHRNIAESDLFNIPIFTRCVHCARNLGEEI